MLDVEGGVDVDAVGEQLLDIEIAFGMAAAGRVGMGELIDESKLRATLEQGVEVHLLERAVFVVEAMARDDFEPLNQRLGLFASVGFDHASDHIDAALGAGPCLLEHLIGFTDARRGAHEDLELAGAAFLSPCSFEQGIRRGSLVLITTLICHEAPVPDAGRTARQASLLAGAVQCQIERQHIDARLAEQPKGAALDVLVDELADAIFGHVARLRNARDLEQGGCRRDLGVKSAARRGDEVDRDRASTGFSCLSLATSALTRSISALLVGPRLEPMELTAL